MKGEQPTETSSNEAKPMILVVDDDRLQLKLSTLRLLDAGFLVKTAASAAEALSIAHAQAPDVILSDVLMGEVDGFGLCRRLRELPALASVPIVLASAHYGEPSAHALASRVGASVLVGRSPEFDAELAAIQGVLAARSAKPATNDRETYEQHLRTTADQLSRLLGEAKVAEGRYRALFDGANDAIAVLNRDAIILEVNPRWLPLLSIEPGALIGRHLLEQSPHGRDTAGPELRAAIERGSGRLYGVPMLRPDGSTIYVDFSISSVEIGARSLVFAIGRDVTGRFLAAQSLAVAEEKYRSLVERLPDVVMTTSRGRCTFVTSNAARLTGFAPSELYAMTPKDWQARVHASDDERVQHARDAFARGGAGHQQEVEYRWQRKDGRWIWLRHRIIAIYERGGAEYADALLSEVTDRKRLEESLRQAQKMEAIGQLTGGIAHDFNNILATILANSQFLLDALGDQDERLSEAQEIKLAAERAAGLTRQLLAFSRRQVLELRVTDLNQVVANLERMLRRLIGEDIELNVRLSPNLGSTHVDPSQLEQVLVNLAVNARDAMPEGGTLTIATSNVELDGDYLSRSGNVQPGRYVMVAVSDTGAGMDEATQRRIFEPFFTTKAPGKGTGLGLATCHGIISQSGGHIGVYSELEQGSVFKVYLPRVDGVAASPVAETCADSRLEGDEVVLLLEDDRPLRAAVQRMLTARGYRVLAARDGCEAVELARANVGELALLLTDVIMPKVSGPAVAEQIRAIVPNVSVLFMSGYTDHAVLTRAVEQQNAIFIQKPFAAAALAAKVREALDVWSPGGPDQRP